MSFDLQSDGGYQVGHVCKEVSVNSPDLELCYHLDQTWRPALDRNWGEQKRRRGGKGYIQDPHQNHDGQRQQWDGYKNKNKSEKNERYFFAFLSLFKHLFLCFLI